MLTSTLGVGARRLPILRTDERQLCEFARANLAHFKARRTVIPCGRSSRWTSYGRSRRLGILTRRSFSEGGSTRLEENSRRPQPDEMRSIFASLRLGGDFWDPQSDIFG